MAFSKKFSCPTPSKIKRALLRMRASTFQSALLHKRAMSCAALQLQEWRTAALKDKGLGFSRGQPEPK
jgi:hypothetical protein